MNRIPSIIPTRFLAGLALAALATTATIGCSSDSATLPNGTVASAIAPWGGQNQNAAVGTTLPKQLLFRVSDSLNHPVSGVTITLTATGGSLGATSGTSGADGTFATTFTLGNIAQDYKVTATIPGGVTPAEITATALP